MPNTDLQILASSAAGYEDILSPAALEFLASLVAKFSARRDDLLAAREHKQKLYDAGELPDFLAETKHIRAGDWKIKGIPADLQDRRVEITGPVERKMIINALNANVKVFMADFEDSLSPTWDNVIQGQVNLRDAVNRNIDFTHADNQKHYSLNEKPAVLIARTRGLHLPEKHITYQGKAIPGCLLDFALYFFHNAETLLNQGSGPYFYIPKLQSHVEARWWDEVFSFAEQHTGLDNGSIKATFLIETLPAAFEMDEILYALKDHVVALNCGRWDYIFSYIKTLRKHPDRVLPNRHDVTMDKPFMNAYSRLLVQTCHKRGALAMGGMAAFIPAKEEGLNQAILRKVTADKLTEAKNGHDGTWVAHPGLADTAMAVFNQYIDNDKPNQLAVSRADEVITAADLLETCRGESTEDGLRLNIRIAVQYIAAWISGSGCVPIYGLMEDAATAEISRASIWQWIQNGITLSNGKTVTKELFREILNQEMATLPLEIGPERFQTGNFTRAAEMFSELTTSNELLEFLTLPGYEELA